MEKNRKFLFGAAFLLLLLLLFSAYSNSFYAPPELDDIHSFIDEPLVLRFDFSPQAVRALAGSKFGICRFLPMFTLAIDQWRGDGSLAAFHVTNFVIHLLCSLAVFWWLLSVLRLAAKPAGRELDPFELMVAVVVAGIWSLSPVQTNAVTYIVQRMTSMAALFCFLSFSLYFAGRRARWQGARRKAVVCWALSGLTFLLALLCKENSAMLPVIILVTELVFRPYGSFGPWSWGRRHKILTIIACFFAIPVVLMAVRHYLPSFLSSYDHRHFTLVERLLTETRVVAGYMFLLLLPLPSRLCFDSHVPLSHSLWSPPATLFSLAGLMTFGVCIILWWRRRPLLSFALLWFFLNLVIESTIIPLELRFEHRLYMPSAGFYLFLVAMLMEFAGAKLRKLDRRLLMSLAVILFAGMSLLTFTRNQDWANSILFNSDCVAKAPEKSRVYNNLCKAYMLAGEYKRGIECAEKAITLGIHGYEEYWAAASNLVASLKKLGRKRDALKRGHQLLTGAPEGAKMNALPAFLCNLAALETENGDYCLAYEHLRRALDLLERSDIALHPLVAKKLESLFSMVVSEGDEEALEVLGVPFRGQAAPELRVAELYLEFYDFTRARRYLDLALKADPECGKCIELKRKLDLIDKANAEQKKYGTLKENYVYGFWKSEFNFRMACAYLIEKFSLPLDSLAAVCLSRAMSMSPESPDPLLLDSWRYFRRGDYDKAIRQIEKAIKLAPDYAQLWVNLGMYRLAAGQHREARRSLLRALALYPGYPKRAQVTAMLVETEKKRKDGKPIDKEGGNETD